MSGISSVLSCSPVAATAFNKPEMPVIIGSAVAGTLLFVLMCWLYSAGVTSSPYSATFGKMIMGMKVTDVTGEPALILACNDPVHCQDLFRPHPLHRFFHDPFL